MLLGTKIRQGKFREASLKEGVPGVIEGNGVE